MTVRSPEPEPLLPWFRFQARDFLLDQRVALMSMGGRGLYVTLLSHFWNSGSLPADLTQLAKLCGISGEEFEALWNEIEECFEQTGDELFPPELSEERTRVIAVTRSRREKGRESANLRWYGTKHGLPNGSPNADTETNAEAENGGLSGGGRRTASKAAMRDGKSARGRRAGRALGDEDYAQDEREGMQADDELPW